MTVPHVLMRNDNVAMASYGEDRAPRYTEEELRILAAPRDREATEELDAESLELEEGDEVEAASVRNFGAEQFAVVLVNRPEGQTERRIIPLNGLTEPEPQGEPPEAQPEEPKTEG
jgi:hypothetical protein